MLLAKVLSILGSESALLQLILWFLSRATYPQYASGTYNISLHNVECLVCNVCRCMLFRGIGIGRARTCRGGAASDRLVDEACWLGLAVTTRVFRRVAVSLTRFTVRSNGTFIFYLKIDNQIKRFRALFYHVFRALTLAEFTHSIEGPRTHLRACLALPHRTNPLCRCTAALPLCSSSTKYTLFAACGSWATHGGVHILNITDTILPRVEQNHHTVKKV